MPRTEVPPISPIGPYPTLPIAANALDFAFVVGDVANGNQIDFGTFARMLVIVQNTNAGAQSFTLNSAADALNREGDIEAYSLATGEFAAFMVARNGWRQSDGKLQINVTHADVKIAVIGIN